MALSCVPMEPRSANSPNRFIQAIPAWRAGTTGPVPDTWFLAPVALTRAGSYRRTYPRTEAHGPLPPPSSHHRRAAGRGTGAQPARGARAPTRTARGEQSRSPVRSDLTRHYAQNGECATRMGKSLTDPENSCFSAAESPAGILPSTVGRVSDRTATNLLAFGRVGRCTAQGAYGAEMRSQHAHHTADLLYRHPRR